MHVPLSTIQYVSSSITEKMLSNEECRMVVQRTLKLPSHEEIKVLNFLIEPNSRELVGYAGEYYKLQVKVVYKEEQKFQYFIKSVPIDNLPHKLECERKGFFHKETNIYKVILPNIQKYGEHESGVTNATKKLFAQCFYSRPDLIVLEDLMQNYRHLTDAESNSLESIKAVLEMHAELHAASIAWEQADNFTIGERYKDILFELQITERNEWYMTGLKTIPFLAGRSEKYKSQEKKQFIADRLPHLLAQASELAKPSKTLRNVLCHRDTWNRNIFFKLEEKPLQCCIVDFQLTCYCAPTLDVLFLLYIVPSAELRSKIFDECLDFYFDCLQAHFKRLNIPSDTIRKEDFLDHCKKSRLAALILWAICEPLTKLPKGVANKMRAEEAEKFDHYMNSDRNELFLRVIAMDPEYERILMVPVEELVDYLLENENLFK